jgi:transposase
MGRFIEGCDRRQKLLLPDCIDDYVGEDSPVRVAAITGLQSRRRAVASC